MPSVIESSATDFVKYPLWEDVDPIDATDLGALSWSISYNPVKDAVTGTPQAATVIAGTASQTVLPNGLTRCYVKVKNLIGSGPGGYSLAAGDWYVYAHTTSGQRVIVLYVGVLTVK